MAKNYQDMNMVELRVHLEKVQKEIEYNRNSKSLLEGKINLKEGNIVAYISIRRTYRNNIQISINNILCDVATYFNEKKQKNKYNIVNLFKKTNSDECLEENRKSIVSSLFSVLKMVEDLFENNEDAELFDSDIKIKVHNFFDWGTPTWGTPISMEPFYKAIRLYQLHYPDIEKNLIDSEKMKDDYNQQLENIEKELKRLELEYYAIKLAMLRKEQSLKNAIASEANIKNNAEFIVNMFDTNGQRQEEGATLSRNLDNIPCTRDGGKD